jgi:hypothetical protein
MVSSEERLKILKMIDEGKISAEEGAKLLAALSESAKASRPRGIVKNFNSEARWLRVRVTDMATGKTKATVNLPIALVDAGLNIASKYAPDVAFDELIASIQAGAMGKLIDVYDETDGEHVEIFIE